MLWKRFGFEFCVSLLFLNSIDPQKRIKISTLYSFGRIWLVNVKEEFWHFMQFYSFGWATKLIPESSNFYYKLKQFKLLILWTENDLNVKAY